MKFNLSIKQNKNTYLEKSLDEVVEQNLIPPYEERLLKKNLEA